MTAAQPGLDNKPSTSGRRQGKSEQAIEALASGVGNAVGWLAARGVLFGIFLVIWVGFLAGLIGSQATIAQAWDYIAGLPLVVQLVAWLLFLPVMLGLWIWEATDWPVIIRLLLVAGLAWFNLIVLLPRPAARGALGAVRK
jgi:hypothetical protein